MRFGSSALFQRHATGKRGVIVEEGDGELIFPPVLQLSTGVGAPMSRFAVLTGTQEGSFATSRVITQDNALASQIITLATLSAGIWSIDWSFSFVFTGTTSAELASLSLVDPAGFNMVLMVHRAVASAVEKVSTGHTEMDLIETGHILRLVTPATVAADLSNTFASVICNRIA